MRCPHSSVLRSIVFVWSWSWLRIVLAECTVQYSTAHRFSGQFCGLVVTQGGTGLDMRRRRRRVSAVQCSGQWRGEKNCWLKSGEKGAGENWLTDWLTDMLHCYMWWLSCGDCGDWGCKHPSYMTVDCSLSLCHPASPAWTQWEQSTVWLCSSSLCSHWPNTPGRITISWQVQFSPVQSNPRLIISYHRRQQWHRRGPGRVRRPGCLTLQCSVW